MSTPSRQTKTEHLSFRVRLGTKHLLSEMSATCDRSMSWIIEDAVREYAEKRGVAHNPSTAPLLALQSPQT